MIEHPAIVYAVPSAFAVGYLITGSPSAYLWTMGLTLVASGIRLTGKQPNAIDLTTCLLSLVMFTFYVLSSPLNK